MNKRIVFLVPYPSGKAPSQRFRFEQYYSFLEEAGFTYEVAPFLDDHTWSILYKPGHFFGKAWGIIKGFFRRLLLLFRVSGFDFVFIHREAAPIGPPFFEWMISQVLGKRVIYDFDDAIWIADTSDNNKIASRLKWHDKVSSICKWAYKVSCGNTYLQEYAKQYNRNAFVVPTTIDTENLHNQVKAHEPGKPVIGWTGTHSTMRYLDLVVPAISQLEKKYDFTFQVISNKAPDLPLQSVTFKPWNKETEIQDLLDFNIGVMPLEDDAWSKGKCAFKALQYMALGIPALVSPVGVNSEVVDHGRNGFICTTTEEWYQAIELLLLDNQDRIDKGREARQKIVQHYSVLATKEKFLALFT